VEGVHQGFIVAEKSSLVRVADQEVYEDWEPNCKLKNKIQLNLLSEKPPKKC
jgi:hypothetical protein